LTDLLIKLFVKDYQKASEVTVRQRYGKFAGVVGIISNLVLFVIKIVAGAIFNSIAITADAINNLSDSGSSLVTLLGFKIAGKPADKQHPFGHARMEYLSGLIVSFLVLFLGLQLIKSSVEKIINPQETQFTLLTMAVLVVAIMIKLWQALFYRKVGRRIDSTALLATAVDSRSDILATSAVLVAALISKLTGYNLDGYMGVVVALFIIYTGAQLVKDTSSPLLGMAPSKEMVDGIYRKILSYEGIIGLHDLRVHNYGEAQYFASVHCEVPASQDIMVSHDIIDNIERDFFNEQGLHMVIHLDPVVADDEKTNELRREVQEIVMTIAPEISMHDFRVVWGVSHTNLIFDIVVPFGLKRDDDEIVDAITAKVYQINPTYNSVITVDHQYVPDASDVGNGIADG